MGCWGANTWQDLLSYLPVLLNIGCGSLEVIMTVKIKKLLRILLHNDGLWEKAICWDCTSVYFNLQWSQMIMTMTITMMTMTTTEETVPSLSVSKCKASNPIASILSGFYNFSCSPQLFSNVNIGAASSFWLNSAEVTSPGTITSHLNNNLLSLLSQVLTSQLNYQPPFTSENKLQSAL